MNFSDAKNDNLNYRKIENENKNNHDTRAHEIIFDVRFTEHVFYNLFYTLLYYFNEILLSLNF